MKPETRNSLKRQLSTHLKSLSSTDKKELRTIAVHAYGHIIQRNERLRGDEFAKRIRQVYDCKDLFSKNYYYATFLEGDINHSFTRNMHRKL